MTRNQSIMLEAHCVGKRFPNGVQALDRVDLAVARGETLALVGESGSGKTTLLRLFNRLEEPTSGHLRVNARPLQEQDPILLRRHTGYVQQEGGLLPHWNVGRNVELVPSLLGWERARRRERADALLRLVGLPPEEYRQRHPAELSGGQRQRVAFARALAADPEVILLDEPFGALDALTRMDLQDEFVKLRRQLGKTMLLVTHDLREAMKLADRIAVMRGGRILQAGTVQDLLHEPADDYVRDLLAHVREDSLQ
jgi:osmoprotectant transport system ATP-binding protein